MIAENFSQVLPEEGVVDRENPWPGLAAFREADSAFFHGRAAAIDELHRRVCRERLTLLFGLSGLGKTSLLHAGLFPLLREEQLLPILVRLDYTAAAPDLVNQVEGALFREAEQAGVEVPPQRPGEGLWEYLHRPENELWSPRNRLLIPVLVFDQFEEIFTLGLGRPGLEGTREAFIAELADLVEGRPPVRIKARLEADPEVARAFDFQRHPYKVLLTLREDFLPELEALRGRMPSLIHNGMRLQRMSSKDALQVVLGAGGHLVDPSVAKRIVRFVSAAERVEGGAFGRFEVEPALLSVVCRELNVRRQQRGDDRITADLLEGDRNDILVKFYERGVADVTAAMRCFLEERLITASGFRDSVALENALGVPGIEREAVDRLVARRLLRIEERGGVPRLELTHDVLTGVVRASRDARREAEATDAAEAARREAEEREHRAHAKLRRSRIASVVLAALFLVTTLLGIKVYQAKRDTEAARAEAERKELKAQAARINTSYNRARDLADRGERKAAESLAYLASILRLEPNHPGARYLMDDLLLRRAWILPRLVLPHDDALLGAVTSDDGRVILTVTRSGIAQIWDGRTGRRRGEPLRHEGFIVDAAISPAGDRVVTTDLQGGARLWGVASGQTIGKPIRHEDLITWVGFTADNLRIVTASRDRTARLWDAASGLPIGKPMEHDDRVEWAALSRDGRRLVTDSEGGTARLWDARNGRPVGAPMRHEDSLWDLAVSSDGARVLTINSAGARLWDGRTGRLLEFFGHQQHPFSALGAWVRTGQFSPDGQLIAFGTRRGYALIWSIEQQQMSGLWMLHGAEVTAVEFSADGRKLLTVSDDDSVSLWDVRTGALLGYPMRHGGAVSTADFSGVDNLSVVTASADSTVRVWNLHLARGAGYPLFRDPGSWWTVLDADGRAALVECEEDERRSARAYDVATGSPLGPSFPLSGGSENRLLGPGGRRALLIVEGKGHLWNTINGTELVPPLHHDDGAIEQARLGASGRLVVTLSQGGSVRVWELATGRPVGRELPYGSPVDSTILAADLDRRGEYLATADDDGKVRLWKLPSMEAVGKPLQYPLPVTLVRFLPGGQLLAAAGRGDLWLRDVATSELVEQAMRHNDWVSDAEASVDGRRLVTTSLDGTARVWSLPDGKAIGRPIRIRYAVERAQFSPDRRSFITIDAMGWARRWDTETGESLGLELSHGSGYGAAFDAPLGFTPSEARFMTDRTWVTAGRDGTTIVWESTTGSPDDPRSLADLAEAVSGFEVDAAGTLRSIHDPAARLKRLRARARTGNLPFVRWFLSEPWKRTITPFSQITVEQYLRRRLNGLEGALRGLTPDTAQEFERRVRSELEISFPGHPMLQRPAEHKGPP
jgi:WD40 repeat protein